MGVNLNFNFHDLWVGVYWSMKETKRVSGSDYTWRQYNVYICLIPTLPIRINWMRVFEEKYD